MADCTHFGMYEQRRYIPTYWYQNQLHRGSGSENLGRGLQQPPLVRRVTKNSLVRRGLKVVDRFYISRLHHYKLNLSPGKAATVMVAKRVWENKKLNVNTEIRTLLYSIETAPCMKNKSTAQTTFIVAALENVKHGNVPGSLVKKTYMSAYFQVRFRVFNCIYVIFFPVYTHVHIWYCLSSSISSSPVDYN